MNSRESTLRYWRSEKGRLARRRAHTSVAGRASARRFRQSEKGRLAAHRHNHSVAGKTARHRYDASPKGKQKRRRFDASPKGLMKAARNTALRRARKLKQAVPGFAKEIARIYARAQELRQWFKVEVDHIIPLAKGGLHAPNNLQIIYRSENAKKGARLDYKPEVVFV